MLRRTSPEVGCWYEHAELGSLFEVVAVDEDDNLVAIQYFEGEIEEMELDSFIQQPLRQVDQPEDWSGPFEVAREDRFESDFAPGMEDAAGLTDFDAEDAMHIIEDL